MMMGGGPASWCLRPCTIYIDEPIVGKFTKKISMHKILVDDEIFEWRGSDEDFVLFSAAFNEADPSIKVTCYHVTTITLLWRPWPWADQSTLISITR